MSGLGSIRFFTPKKKEIQNVPTIPALEKEKETLNETILELLKSYPLGGEYYWPKDATDGVTRELTYMGSVVARPEPQGRTFCCGLTFEVYLRACEEYAKKNNSSYYLNGYDAREIRRMKSEWFVATGDRSGVGGALYSRGLGFKVDFYDAEPGDFCQLWRENGSGHSVIFLNRVEDGIHYWTTQTSTNGIGERTELFSGPKPLKELYMVRALVPKLYSPKV